MSKTRTGTGNFENNFKLREKEIKENKAILKCKPTRMGIIFGNKCNIKCKMCGNQGILTRMHLKKPRKLNHAVLDDTISYFPYFEKVILSGGEPLLYPETKKVVKIAKNFPNLKLTMYTNGNLINDYWINKFCDIPFKRIAFSIDAATQKTYQRIRIKGDLNKIIESLKKINDIKNGRSSDPELWAAFIIMKRNFHEILDFIEFAHKYGISGITYLPICNQKSLFYAFENVTVSKKNCFELLKIREKIQDLSEDYNIEISDLISGQVLQKNPSAFYEYYNIKEDDLNIDGNFKCSRYWKRLEVSYNFYTSCIASIQKYWDPFFFYSTKPANLPTINDVWNHEKLIQARKYIISGQFDKVCKISCPGYFNYKTKGVI